MNNNMRNLAWSIAQSIDPSRRFKHVSLIVKNKSIISVGTNERKTHTAAMRHGYRFSERHSELAAFTKVPKNMRHGLILVNYRFNNQGELRLSKPCIKCMPWVMEVFDEVYFSDDKGMVKI